MSIKERVENEIRDCKRFMRLGLRDQVRELFYLPLIQFNRALGREDLNHGLIKEVCDCE
jgi:hypothetical protein